MIEIYDSLSNHTTLKIGGEAKILIPETKHELVSLINDLQQNGEEFKILGAGSNILAADHDLDFTVIKTTKCCTDLKNERRKITAGASVMMPQLVHFAVQNDLGGLENLYSVPGTVGGGIFMNAGRGFGRDSVISWYLESVEIFDGEEIREIPRVDLTFGNRYSTFQEHNDWIILSAEFKFREQPREIGRKLLKERMEAVSNKERSLPNAGSTFLKTGFLEKVIPENFLRATIHSGDARYAHKNRFINAGNSDYEDMIKAVNKLKFMHQVIPFISVPEFEWIVWDDTT